MSDGKEDSRERFLVAAEGLFVEHGYKGTTIRAICAEANTSLAILNRNWSSKEALFAEMLKRHFDPLHELQNRLLNASHVQCGKPDLSKVVTAFFQPAFRDIGSTRGHRASVYSRALIDPSREIKQIVASLIDQTRSQLIELVREALPDIDQATLFVAMNVVFGAYVYPQAFGHQLATAMKIDDSTFDWNNGSYNIVSMICSGIVKTTKRSIENRPSSEHLGPSGS